MSYLDETAMNVAQELGDRDIYNYDVLVKLLGDRFDPASRVSASRSRFHARLRCHHEDADAFADAIAELCRCNRLRCPLARMSGLQCFSMGHNGHGINLYGVSMTLMVN